MKSRQVFLKYRQKVDTILRKIQTKSKLLGTKYRLFVYNSVHKGWVLVTISLGLNLFEHHCITIPHVCLEILCLQNKL